MFFYGHGQMHPTHVHTCTQGLQGHSINIKWLSKVSNVLNMQTDQQWRHWSFNWQELICMLFKQETLNPQGLVNERLIAWGGDLIVIEFKDIVSLFLSVSE